MTGATGDVDEGEGGVRDPDERAGVPAGAPGLRPLGRHRRLPQRLHGPGVAMCPGPSAGCAGVCQSLQSGDWVRG